ncbi:MAG: competence/damage-inducible protein A [Rhizobiaceae bacterium]|nr:competence/damage-inducible protein A [Rhizobiaceae bacterium]
MSDIKIVTAAMLVIGDEILSGRTKDKNIGFVADYLTGMGIDLNEVRIVADEKHAIIEAVNALRRSYDYVFTTGGIGPTHDDITAESIAEAFGVPCEPHPKAMQEMAQYYASRDMEFTKARQRMARTPRGAELIDNPISKAPGIRIENVHIMAGVPQIMQAMMDAIAPTLEGGQKILSQTVDCPYGEGTVGGPLGEIQDKHPNTMIGSYPRYENGNYSTQIVVRGRDQNAVALAIKDVKIMLKDVML